LTSLQAGETLLPQINAVVGLSSLGAKNLLIDMPRREACWF
jgi:hypothetical protein